MTEKEIIEYTVKMVKKGAWQKSFGIFISDLKGRERLGDKGYVFLGDNGLMIMSLPNTTDSSWSFYETVLHESVHAAEAILKYRNETGATEALAHTVEYIFHSIRKQL